MPTRKPLAHVIRQHAGALVTAGEACRRRDAARAHGREEPAFFAPGSLAPVRPVAGPTPHFRWETAQEPGAPEIYGGGEGAFHLLTKVAIADARRLALYIGRGDAVRAWRMDFVFSEVRVEAPFEAGGTRYWIDALGTVDRDATTASVVGPPGSGVPTGPRVSIARVPALAAWCPTMVAIEVMVTHATEPRKATQLGVAGQFAVELPMERLLTRVLTDCLGRGATAAALLDADEATIARARAAIRRDLVEQGRRPTRLGRWAVPPAPPGASAA